MSVSSSRVRLGLLAGAALLGAIAGFRHGGTQPVPPVAAEPIVKAAVKAASAPPAARAARAIAVRRAGAPAAPPTPLTLADVRPDPELNFGPAPFDVIVDIRESHSPVSAPVATSGSPAPAATLSPDRVAALEAACRRLTIELGDGDDVPAGVAQAAAAPALGRVCVASFAGIERDRDPLRIAAHYNGKQIGYLARGRWSSPFTVASAEAKSPATGHQYREVLVTLP